MDYKLVFNLLYFLTFFYQTNELSLFKYFKKLLDEFVIISNKGLKQIRTGIIVLGCLIKAKFDDYSDLFLLF